MPFGSAPYCSLQENDGRKLLDTLKNIGWEGMQLIMDKACESEESRQLAFDLEMIPVVPPKRNRLTMWKYDKEMYKKRDEAGRLFHRLKGFFCASSR